MRGGRERYFIHLRFYIDSSMDSRGFPIGEQLFDQRLTPGQVIALPHSTHPFFHDLPQAYVDHIVPSSLIGDPSRAYVAMDFPRSQKDLPIMGSLLLWYQHPHQL